MDPTPSAERTGSVRLLMTKSELLCYVIRAFVLVYGNALLLILHTPPANFYRPVVWAGGSLSRVVWRIPCKDVVMWCPPRWVL